MTDNVQAVELNSNDCVLIFSDQGMKAHIGEDFNDPGEMPGYVFLALAIAHLSITDPEWVQATLERYESAIDNMSQELN